ncbi:MAG: hypothetical protein WBG38_15630, partial [Nodosilinea sp.]
MDIQVAIAGQDAVAATEALLAIDGISGTYALESETNKEGILVTIATIVGLVGGTLAIAEQIRKWYQEYRQGKDSKPIEKVVIVSASGQRLLLENATT